MPVTPFPSYAELRRDHDGAPASAWGVFGHDDQVGTLNHLTPDRVKSAISSVVEGVTFNLNLPLDLFDPPLIAHRGAVEHHVFGLNEFHRDDRIDNLYTQASTQLDSLRHFAHPDYGFYNGARGEAIVQGSPTLGIQHVAARGIVGRGVLVDVGEYRKKSGRPIDQDSDEQIPVSEIDAALQSQGSTVSPGDILLIRFGWLGHIRRPGFVRPATVVSPGLAQREETAAWLWDKQVSMVAADNIALEAWPPTGSTLTTQAEARGSLAMSSHSGMLHRLLIPMLGMTIGELWDLDGLAAACALRGRYDALITAEPLNITGGVGSPANALAVI